MADDAMLSTEQILQNAAKDGSIDITHWPRVLEDLLAKLHRIVYNDFPIPPVPLPGPLSAAIDPEVVVSTPLPPPVSEPASRDEANGSHGHAPSTNSQSSTKENDGPAEGAPSTLTAFGYEVTHAQQPDTTPSTQRVDSTDTLEGSLPPDLLSMYQQSRRTLETDFANSPPYTIQRLADLVVEPKRHYRFLPSYLRALDRVVSVSSPTTDFPLPNHVLDTNGFLTNGEVQANGIAARDSLGSDESLGGALLSPIPWLRSEGNALAPPTGPDGLLHSEGSETIDGPHGAGRIETVTVTVNGVPSASSAAHTTPTQSPIASPTLSEQSDASTSSASSSEAQSRDQGAITQGELLRQEQEAGIVPIGQVSRFAASSQGMTGSAPGYNHAHNITTTLSEEPSDERPHSGPEAIGMEDMGPQARPVSAASGLNIDAAVGRSRSKSPQPPDSSRVEEQEQDQMEDVESVGAASDVERDVEKLKEAMDREEASVASSAEQAEPE